MDSRIFLVDDMEIALDLLKTFLNRAGFKNIKTYDCPLRALHDMEQGLLPDIIITDYRMPGMNGLQFIEAASSVISYFPAIIITGDPESISKIPENCKVLEKGGTDFFSNLVSLIKDAQVKTGATKQNTRVLPLKYKSRRLFRKDTVKIKTF